MPSFPAVAVRASNSTSRSVTRTRTATALPEPVLQHVSFTAEPGTVCAIVGSTGSGKSTVIKLIERFYDVTSGSVKIDGIDVRDLTQEKLRGTVGYVPQKAFLFSGPST